MIFYGNYHAFIMDNFVYRQQIILHGNRENNR
jgi:hypothetical protein